jgi:hypothetical protein
MPSGKGVEYVSMKMEYSHNLPWPLQSISESSMAKSPELGMKKQIKLDVSFSKQYLTISITDHPFSFTHPITDYQIHFTNS